MATRTVPSTKCGQRSPITGIADSCARATSGHAAAAPPSRVMNSIAFGAKRGHARPYGLARLGRWSLRIFSSIRLNVGVLGHLFPHAELNLHESSQLLGRASVANALISRLST